MVGNIFDIPVKETINATLQSKSIMIVGKSKTGKSTISASAPRPVFLMTENGGEMLTGFTPVPISSWSDFKNAVTQLCNKKGRENFDTVVIDTYTNLILLLDKYIGQRLSTDKKSLSFGSDADYGRGTKAMKRELGIQLQKLANQGYLLLNIVHAEDKTDFNTQQSYIGTSLPNSLFGVAEKFVDQIIYLKREKVGNEIEYRTYFNTKGGFSNTGGRISPDKDFVPTSFKNIEKALLEAIEVKGENGAKLVEQSNPSVIFTSEEDLDFSELMKEFTTLTQEIMGKYPNDGVNKIKEVTERELGVGRKVSTLSTNQAELLQVIVNELKNI